MAKPKQELFFSEALDAVVWVARRATPFRTRDTAELWPDVVRETRSRRVAALEAAGIVERAGAERGVPLYRATHSIERRTERCA